MATDGSGNNDFLEGQALAVDLSNMEATLRRLWAEEQHSGQQVMRACVLNLVIYAGNEGNAALATEVVAQLTTTHPCRAIVLMGDETDDQVGSGLRAWLSAHCQLPQLSGQRLCCEQVTLQASGEAVEQLPSAVLPLLVPDLPVALWWMTEVPFGAPIFEQLMDVADRLIVDTMRFEDPTFSITQLAALVRSNASGIAVSDLNWARLTQWQEELAQVFDSADTLPYLERLERVIVQHARQEGSSWVDPEQALLLVGWLLSRLGWKLPPALARVSSGHFRGRLRRAGRDLAVEITPHDVQFPTDEPEGSGRLVSVELRASLNNQEALFRVERHVGDGQAMTTAIKMGDLEPLTRTRMLPERNLASLLAEDLNRFDHDYLFEAALETAAHLSGAAQLLPR